MRERRVSLPLIFPEATDWGTYFDDLGGMVPFPDQMLYIRPDYSSPDSFASIDSQISHDDDDDDSAVEYVIETSDSVVQNAFPVTKVMVDTAIEADKKE